VFELLKKQIFSASPSIPKSDQTKAKSFIKYFKEKIFKINENQYEVIGNKATNVYKVDLIEKKCICIRSRDRGSCKHLIECVIYSDNIYSLNTKFNIFDIVTFAKRKTQTLKMTQKVKLIRLLFNRHQLLYNR
jgi:hypothetical protein